LSNNSEQAIRRYLVVHDLTRYIDHIAARYDGMDPRRLKPDTHLVDLALTALGIPPADSVVVGDSPSDIQAGRVAGTRTIGYANEARKVGLLTGAASDAVVETMSDLAEAMTAAAQR
jgi:phosphoglycolate phosphatase